MKQKAISPLVATTLLIVLTIGLSTLILNWISVFSNDHIETSNNADNTRNYCATARADIVSIVIDNTNKTIISVQNVGDTPINLTDAYLYNQNSESCKLLFDDSNLEVGDFAMATNISCPIINTCADFSFVDVITNCKNTIVRYNGVLTPTSNGGCKL